MCNIKSSKCSHYLILYIYFYISIFYNYMLIAIAIAEVDSLQELREVF